jgi:hypothetical protein
MKKEWFKIQHSQRRFLMANRRKGHKKRTGLSNNSKNGHKMLLCVLKGNPGWMTKMIENRLQHGRSA